MRPPLCSLLIALLAYAPLASDGGELWVVDPEGGPADFSTIQAAVDAAGEGDVILVDSSAPIPIPAAAGFVIDGKSLTIVAREFAGPFLGGKQVVDPCVVKNLAADQRVVLRCLQLTSSQTHNRPSLRIESCAGPVFVEDCDLTAGLQLDKREALVVKDSGGVVVARCLVDGGAGNPFAIVTSGQAGVRSERSHLLLYASEVLGGGGTHTGGGSAGPAQYGIRGQPAVRNSNGQVFASGCVLRGGNGGDGALETFGCLDPGAGGCAVQTEGTGVSTLHDVALFAGGAGEPAPSCQVAGPTPELGGDGAVVHLDGKARGLIAPAPLDEGEDAEFHLIGQPGDLVFLGLDYSPALEPHLGLTWSVLSDPSLLTFVGAVGSSGDLRHIATPAPLSPRFEALTGWFQARFLPLGGGTVKLSNPSVGVRLGGE